MADLREIVNTDLYPLTDSASADYQEIVARLHHRLKTDGFVILPDFMTKKSIEQTVHDAKVAAKTAFTGSNENSVYVYLGEEAGIGFDADHPLNLKCTSSATSIVHDQIKTSTPLNMLYRSDVMTEFIRGILGRTALYRTADPLGALNIHVFNDQNRLGWHFDGGQFSVTLLLQAPQAGGHFEYAPSIRSNENENYDEVRQILLKSRAGQDLSVHGVKQVSLKAGTLMVFNGRNSLHHVTPVCGDTARIIGVLSYEEKPGIHMNEYTKMRFYGRVN